MISRQQQLIRLAFLVGAMLFIGSASVWWTKIYTSPERVFWSTIENNLSTASVTREILEQSSPDVSQYVRLQLGGINLAQTQATVVSGDDVQSSQTISTPEKDYIRYTKLATSQKASDGKAIDLSNIENIWAADDSASAGDKSQLFSQVFFGSPLPIAALNSQQRSAIMAQLKDTNVLKVDFSKVKKNTINGQQVYQYEVSLNAAGYITVLKLLGEYVGLNDFMNIDASQYLNQDATKMTVSMKPYARQLARISMQNGAYTENYSSYGVPVADRVPTGNIISVSELRDRFTKAIGQ